MTEDEFAFATITQELRMLATTRRTDREVWLHVVMPSVVRVATLSNVLAETRDGSQGGALRGLAEAVSSLAPGQEAEDSASDPHSSDTAWAKVVTAAAELRNAFSGAVPAWVLPH
jgi:hypothetical protein